MRVSRTSVDSFVTATSLPVSRERRSRPGFSYEAIYKLPRDKRYFNVSVLWIAYYPHLTHLLYALRIRHEVVTLLSLACGPAAAAILTSQSTAAALVLCAVLIHLKDVFDACDGSLARLTGTGHRIGRFLDTIGDGVVFTALIAAVAWYGIARGGHPEEMCVWAGAAWLSLFLQCSYFNFYHLQYARLIGAESRSRLDESSMDGTDGGGYRGAARLLLTLLQRLYLIWFGWQDRLIQALDRLSLRTARPSGRNSELEAARWYGARGFLVANSALCYGTHAFVLILCVLGGRPTWFLPAVAVGMNLYLATIIVSRWVVFREAA